MPITYSTPGKREQIKKITGKDDIRRHLAELGLSEGEYVTIVSETNGNVILMVKNSRIALDKSLANRIIV